MCTPEETAQSLLMHALRCNFSYSFTSSRLEKQKLVMPTLTTDCVKRCGHEKVEGILQNDPEYLKKEEMLKQCNECQAKADAGIIIEEIHMLAGMWHSDMAKRGTVEHHLRKRGINDVSRKIDTLIELGMLTEVKGGHDIPYLSTEKTPKGFQTFKFSLKDLVKQP